MAWHRYSGLTCITTRPRRFLIIEQSVKFGSEIERLIVVTVPLQRMAHQRSDLHQCGLLLVRGGICEGKNEKGKISRRK